MPRCPALPTQLNINQHSIFACHRACEILT
jgi:hypothetical protein